MESESEVQKGHDEGHGSRGGPLEIKLVWIQSLQYPYRPWPPGSTSRSWLRSGSITSGFSLVDLRGVCGHNIRDDRIEVEEGVYPVPEVRHVGHDLRAASLEVEEGVYPVPEVRHVGHDLRAASLEDEEGVYPVPEVRHVGHDLRAASLEVEEGVYPVPEVRHVGHDPGLVALGAADAPGNDAGQLPLPLSVPHCHRSARVTLHHMKSGV